MFPRLFIIFLLIFSVIFIASSVRADEIQDIQNQIDQLNKVRELSVKATKPLEGQLEGLQRQLAQIQASINGLTITINKKQKDLDLREEKLALQQALLEKRVRQYYIRSYLTNPLLVILSSLHAGDLFRELSYRQTVAKEDRMIITSVTSEEIDLLTEKTKLEKDKSKLALLQAEVDKNAAFIGGEVKKAKAYTPTLSSQIASLTAKQQSILASRLASLNIPLYASAGGSCSSDLTNGKDPGFSGGFGLFTYGVPNRVMFQEMVLIGQDP